jgi:hypothetical protein
MSRQRHITSDIKYQLLLSFAGLLLVVILTAFPPAVTEDVLWRKPLIGLIFSSICVLGVLAVFSPNKCLGIFSIGKKKGTVSSDSAKLASHGASSTLEGHHPSCGNYDAHVFRINGKTVCAACAGLLIGGLSALTGAAAYFFGDWSVAEYSSWMVLLGVAGVSLCLFQFKFIGLARLSVNAFFVVGSLLILVGVDGLVHSLVFDLLVVSLIVFWLLTRISLSHWDHEMICSACEVENCGIWE